MRAPTLTPRGCFFVFFEINDKAKKIALQAKKKRPKRN
jgi:hypothetical protein